MNTTRPLLAVDGLGKSFGGVRAVDGIGFKLETGEMLALIGPNGAGKSTTFNMVNGQLRADSGSVRLAGQELVGRRPRDIWRLGVGRTFQIAETFASLTVVENVQMALLSHDRLLFSLWRRAADHRRADALALLDQVGMVAQADRPCSVLAYGDVKRVELAIAMAHAPRLLLMDEPTAGMAPQERHALMALTQRLVRELGKSFGGVKAVDGISFDLRAGELLALIGPNGAGKTTTFNMVNGQLQADRGSIRLGGHELIGRRPRDIWRLGVGRTFQIAETFESLTVVENVQMA